MRVELTRQAARAEALYAEGKSLGVVFSAGLPYRTELESHVRRVLRDESLVDDVLQQVHLEAWQAVEAGERPQRLWGYLYTIAQRRAFDVLRTQRLPAPPETNAAVVTPYQQVLLRDLLTELSLRLSPRQWSAWEQHYVVGSSIAEIARMTKVSRKSVRTLLHRAQNAVRKIVGDGDGA